MRKRIIVGLSGSSGAYGVRVVEVLSGLSDVETHVVVTGGAKATISYETDRSPDEVMGLADVVYEDNQLGAAIASGTFVTDGMVVAPCSIKTLSSIANSYDANLITRAADVCLKERRRLVLVVRETPLPAGHIRLMAQATEIGRGDPSPGARLLHEARDHRGHRRSHRNQDPRPVRHRRRPRPMVRAVLIRHS